MSKLPFVLTLLVSGTLLAWLFATPEAARKEKPRAKEKSRPVLASAAVAPRPAAPERLYGYPDPRGVLLELRQNGGSCPASQFRNQSPIFVLWDDGNVVSMSPTYDYRRGRVSIAQATLWSREFRSFAVGHHPIDCRRLRDRAVQGDTITLRGRTGDGDEATLAGPNPSFGDPAHLAACADCRSLSPLARLLEEIDGQRKNGGHNETLSGLPVEVHLEWRSCGCRNHPEIVNVSKEWPLEGVKPAERCGRTLTRFRLEDPAEIRLLSDAIARSAAVLDRGEIYTCFMRPILELRPESPLARK